MLAMDYYPLRRHERLGWGRLLGEKALLLALAVAVAALTVITQSHEGGRASLKDVRLSQHIFLTFQSLAFYPWKLVWPAHLSPFYPLRTDLSLDQWPVLASVLSVAIITALAVSEARRLPAVTAAWGTYLALVLPVSWADAVGLSTVATRYAYVATLPLLLLTGGAAVWLWRRSAEVVRVAIVGLLAGGLCVLGQQTRCLIPVWHDTETFWRTVCARFPDSTAANRSLVYILLAQGKPGEALECAQRYVEIVPELDSAHFDLGTVLARLGRLQDAVVQYEQAARINPNYVEAHVNLGSAYLQEGRTQDAIGQYEQVLRIDPDDAEAYSNLGAILQRMGRLEDRRRGVSTSLAKQPDYVEAHFNLGLALEKLGRTPEAIEQYGQALKLQPDFAAARNAMVRLHMTQGSPGTMRTHGSHWAQWLCTCHRDIRMHGPLAGWEALGPNAADSYYNLLVDGFAPSHLSLKKEVPLGLTQLTNPYDPTANAVYRAWPYRVLDLSYYRSRLYLYFGVTPALILFWRFVALTGHYLSHRLAVWIFCAIGFLTSVGLLYSLWRRYFTEVSVSVVAACALHSAWRRGVPVAVAPVRCLRSSN